MDLGATASIASDAIAMRTPRKSTVGMRSRRSRIRKNLEPHSARTDSSARLARSVTRDLWAMPTSHQSAPSDEVEGDLTDLGQHRPGEWVRPEHVAAPDVAVVVLDDRDEAGVD